MPENATNSYMSIKDREDRMAVAIIKMLEGCTLQEAQDLLDYTKLFLKYRIVIGKINFQNIAVGE
jgi:hypothetical protein